LHFYAFLQNQNYTGNFKPKHGRKGLTITIKSFVFFVELPQHNSYVM